ncbi:hypothetical protein J0S82_014911 [Galemys pyrenaicus]|uniref:Uncharacterized protein n=1 Tax=Galemys pyrenaicus TaxID=202257 RepID=A0A8J6ADL3_GALPY|nr:hypothetical protein J0S82_014911 [Galemys pyrenaicus]
MMLQKSPN